MRALGPWVATLAILLGAGQVYAGPEDAASDADASGAKSGGNWLTRWFTPAPKPADKVQKPKDIKKEKHADGDTTQGTGSAHELSAVRAEEEAKYIRRLEVCDRLKEIADLSNDLALRKRAEALEARAFDVYTQRTAHLPSSRAVFDSDDKTLEKHLGATPGKIEDKTEADVYTVPGDNDRSRTKGE